MHQTCSFQHPHHTIPRLRRRRKQCHVQARGKERRIKGHPVPAGLDPAVNQNGDFSAEDIQNDKSHRRRLYQLVLDRGKRIEWIRMILRQAEVSCRVEETVAAFAADAQAELPVYRRDVHRCSVEGECFEMERGSVNGA